jgi:hypothetical protein
MSLKMNKEKESMRYPALAVIILTMLLANTWSFAGEPEHSDVVFQYIGERIELSSSIFETFFPTSGIDQQFQSDPGFSSETDVGLGIHPGDQIVYHVLDNLLFWNGMAFQAPADGTQVRVRNNPPTVPDTLITATSGVQLGSVMPPLNRIGQASASGDFHSHVEYFLEPFNFPLSPPPPALGAYGLKLNLATSALGIADSDPFIVVFNFGLADLAFEQAVAAFGDLLVSAPVLGDMDCDGDVDFDDIDEFVLGLNDPAAYEMLLGVAPTAKGDVDQDGDFDFDDITGFVGVLNAEGPRSVPEPSGFAYMLACSLLLPWRKRISGTRFPAAA